MEAADLDCFVITVLLLVSADEWSKKSSAEWQKEKPCRQNSSLHFNSNLHLRFLMPLKKLLNHLSPSIFGVSGRPTCPE